MERYNYREEMIEDIINYINTDGKNYKMLLLSEIFDEKDFESLYEKLWAEDSITGNTSGSYWLSNYKAEEALCHNWDLFIEANQEFGYRKPTSAEDADVLIRCYLLRETLNMAIEKICHEAEIDLPF